MKDIGETTAGAPPGASLADLASLVKELLVQVAAIVEQRWKVLLAPVAIALVLGFIATKLAPTTYTAKSLILLQSANRAAGSNAGNFNRQNALDQISAVEAWLKSDEVLSALLPRLQEPGTTLTPVEFVVQARIFRQALTLELVGGVALEIRLEGRNPKGLANKLEVVLTRVMEGLTGPEQGIFNAQQFVQLKRNEAAAAADAALSRAIARLGLKAPEKVRGQLRQLYEIERKTTRSGGTSGGSDYGQAIAPVDARVAQELRADISSDARVLAELETLYFNYAVARQQLDGSSERLPVGRSNYVGLFDTPENLLVVGRPQDPVTGESSARKLVIASILLSILLSVAITALLEVLEGRLRTSSQFANASGLPVVARV